MSKKIFTKIIRNKYKIFLIFIVSFLAAIFIPGGQATEMINIVLGVIGLMFAIIIGFFINDLWNRYEVIRENVAVEVSGLQTYYIFVKIINNFPGHEKWAKEQQKFIDEYVRKFFEVEWNEYGEIDPYFNRIIESLKNIGELKTDVEVETYTNMPSLLNEVTTSREKLFMFGKDRLTKQEWAVIITLSAALLFCIFFIKTAGFSSIFLAGILTSTVFILLSFLHDLDDLSFGEETVSFEPYETIFDVIEKPRFYRKRDLKMGRVTLPKDKKYRLVE